MKSKTDQGLRWRKDAAGRKPGAVWPLGVKVSAASMVVDKQVAAKRVADELRIPYTTLEAG